MMQSVVRVALLVLVVGAAVRCGAQTSSELNTYFQQYVGLSQDQVAAIRGGQAVVTPIQLRGSLDPGEVLKQGNEGTFIRERSK
jgi:hypothetical protein